MAKLNNLLLAALCAAILSTTLSVGHAAGFRERGPAYIDSKGPNALVFDGQFLRLLEGCSNKALGRQYVYL